MRKIDNNVPVQTATKAAIRAQKTGGQTYDDVVRVMAALYIEARRKAENEMSGQERIQARAQDLTPVEYVHDLDVDGILSSAARSTATASESEDQGGSGGEADVIAEAALGGRERVEADQRSLSPAEYIWEDFGLDAEDYDDSVDLRDDIEAQEQAQGASTGRKHAEDYDHLSAGREAGQGTATDELAASALSGQDRVALSNSDLAAADFVRDRYGVDPADFSDSGDLATAIQNAEG